MALALPGCGTTHLTNELKPYLGRDLHDLVTQLGKPTGQQETSGERVYVWTTDSDGTLAANPFAAEPGGGGGFSYAGSGTRGGLIPVRFQCTIEITVDAHDIIQHYQFEGSNAGCSRYRKLLTR